MTMEIEYKKENKLTPINEDPQNIRRSNRTKTPSTIFSEMFEETLIPAKRSITKPPAISTGKKSFQKRGKADNESPSKLRSRNDAENTSLRHENGKLISEELAFLSTVNGEGPTEMKVFFVLNDAHKYEYGRDKMLPSKALSEPLGGQDVQDRALESILLNPPLTAHSITSNYSNNDSERDIRAKKNGSDSISGSHRGRAVRKPKHLNDEDFLFGSKNTFRVSSAKQSKPKREVKKPAPTKSNGSEYKENFLDMILSAAINAQSANKKGPSSELLISNGHQGKTSSNNKSHNGSLSVNKIDKSETHRRNASVAKSIKEHDDLDDSDSTVDRARKENYIKNVEIQSDKIILHHSKLDPCVAKLVRPKKSSTRLSEELLSSEIWKIGKENEEGSTPENSTTDGNARNLQEEEQRLKTYFEQQIKKYKPAILA